LLNPANSSIGNWPVEANGARLRGDLPLRGAEKNADVVGAERGNAGRNAAGFDGMFDGAEEDSVAGDEDDDAATGEIGNDFVFLGEAGRRRVLWSEEGSLE